MLLEVDMLVSGESSQTIQSLASVAHYIRSLSSYEGEGLGITGTKADAELMIPEISRLQNSITHLLRTQDELRGFLQEEPDSDEDGELGRAVQENDITM